jgi:LysR family transcriptional regulator, regulator for metE and metH
MTLELRHLELVRTIVEEGGLTRAGKRLGLSQSALSHQLRGVEEQLGVSLFHRIGRRLVLAPAGERILRAASLVIPEIERTESDLRENSSKMLGTIRLSAECYSCYQWLPAITRRFSRKHPSIDLRIITEATRKPIQALLQNEIDLAVVSGPLGDRRLKLTLLSEEDLVAVTAVTHPLADRKFLRPQDFVGQTLFSYAELSTTCLYLKILQPAGVRPKEASAIPLTEAILELVKAGQGITVLPRWAVETYLGNGEYRALSITSHGLSRRWYAAVRRMKKSPDYLAAFLEALRIEAVAAVHHPVETASYR